MPLAQFLSTLFEDGRVVVPELHDLFDDELAEASDVLERYVEVQRETFPGTPPELDSSVGLWAATRLYRACQFAIYRDLGPERIASEIGEAPSFSRTAAAHFNVDMTFRYLPDLHHIARTTAEDDPLVTILNVWARDWPLSSVGMRNLEPVSIDEFAGDDSLMQCYVDRIIASGDTSRLTDPRVRCLVKAAIGNYPSLSEHMNEALRNYDSPPENSLANNSLANNSLANNSLANNSHPPDIDEKTELN